MLKPDLIMSPSHIVLTQAEALSAPTAFLPLGVDVNRFVPVDEARKLRLRRRHGLPEQGSIALHVGHARPLRGLESIVKLQEEHHDLTSVVVIGSSLGSDPTIVRMLREGGVKVIDRYLPDIQEYYQLADVYVFPVYDEDAAIGAPLSVLEAMACNLPIVTSPFGALPDMLEAADGFLYAYSQSEISPAVGRALGLDGGAIRTRPKVEAYSWMAIADLIVTKAGELSHEL
jgi:glycosyltransferase involved in cell wall biosynthesis